MDVERREAKSRMTVRRDERTQRYFQENTPTYSLGRYNEVVGFLRDDACDGAALLDIGCGCGNVLKLIRDNTPVCELAGLDVSSAYLGQCAGAVPGCATYLGSILDVDLSTQVQRSFRYVLVGAVLHHLVGVTRGESLAYARQGLVGAWSLVDPGGALILMEPTFRPHWAMSALFYVKRLVSRVTSRRVALFGYWNNLGEPVVSYFSHDELLAEATALRGAEVVICLRKTKRLPAPWRLAGVTERADSVMIVRKRA